MVGVAMLTPALGNRQCATSRAIARRSFLLELLYL